MTIEVIKAHPRRGTRGVRTHIRHNPWDETSWEDAERREDERLSAVEAIEREELKAMNARYRDSGRLIPRGDWQPRDRRGHFVKMRLSEE